eukprot:scaffold15460_cov39-Cyclotella_meneghiniana.AAC.1
MEHERTFFQGNQNRQNGRIARLYHSSHANNCQHKPKPKELAPGLFLWHVWRVRIPSMRDSEHF